MSAETDRAIDGAGESSCWCCGRMTDENALVHLGSHPEVGVCVSCVRFLGRRARDIQASGARRGVRAVAESIRGEVMKRGWQERSVIGPMLLWVNRHSPW
ncbi:MAG: hypothetical protein ACR2FU_23225 [Streptosporangiaceae bacterium]